MRMKSRLTKFSIIIFLSFFIFSCGTNNSNNHSKEATLTKIQTEKETYLENQPIIVNFNNMSGHQYDWIGIYPVGISSDWGNQLQWAWTEGDLNGQKEFHGLPLGTYEVRAFFNNSFNVAAISSFKIDGEYNANKAVSLTLNKSDYAENELIYVNYNNMQGNQTDWIGLFSLGSDNPIDSKQTQGSIKGELSLGGLDRLPDSLNNFGGLKSGNYEVKALFNNSLKVEKIASFTVVEKKVTSTIYESADNNISPHWVHLSGPVAPYYNQGMVNLTSNWINNSTNTSEYRLTFPQVNRTQKVLELEAGGLKYQKHFYIGVILETLHGPRKMIWDPFFTHGKVKPFKSNQLLSYPLYIDIQLESEQRNHVRVDVEKYLRILEPTNKVLSISAFIASGGDLDEIKLSSH